MPSDRSSLHALRDLLLETALILETIPNFPQDRIVCCRKNLRAALALTDDLLKQQRMTPVAIMGHKGGSTTARKLGVEHYRKMAAARWRGSAGRDQL